MKKAYLLAGLGVGVIALTASSFAFADSGNYSAWRASLANQNGRAAQVVNEKNFDRFTAMHQAVVDGKYDEAQKIRTELGLGQGRANKNGGARKGGCGMAAGGCGMQGSGTGTGFVDVNKNGVCDAAEQLKK